MKNNLKRIAAIISAAMVIGTASMSVSAATKEDVIAAARGAGFLEEYVQTLQNYLNVTTYTSAQYDIMVGAISSAGEEMDSVALQYFGKTVAEMKGDATSADGTFDDSFLVDIADKLEDDNIVEILDEMVEAGKELGLDVTFEQKGEKEYVLTVKDKDGNVQLVTPIGKLVDRTGAEEIENNTVFPMAFAGLTALGCVGAFVISKSLKKNEEN